MMLYGVEKRLAMRRMIEIKKNLGNAVGAIPRWGGRISDKDRDALIQVLADLEHLHAIINEDDYKGMVRAAVK